MAQPNNRTLMALWTVSIIAVVTIAISLGYGSARATIGAMRQTIASAKHYPTERLSIIYERQCEEKSDFVHLRIDTTYRQIGKAGYNYQIVCDRKYSLREFDTDYNEIDDAVGALFIEGDKAHKWLTSSDKRRLMDYNASRATTTIDGTRYEAWHTDELPHLEKGAIELKPRHGVILEAYDDKGNYSLRIKHITQQIG